MTTPGLPDVKVGDTLILVTGNHYRGDEPVTVSRIGRVYLYVTVGGSERSERFDRHSGVEVGNVGVRARLYTAARYDEIKQRSALFEQLRQVGIDVRHEARSEVTTGQLRALLAVMQQETP
jgi:hypothetical protein